MFGRNKDAATAQEVVDEAAAAAKNDPRAGKGVPTPSRKEQEAARKRPLVPNDRNAAKVADREARREAQLRTRAALDSGDERYLPVRDKGPQRRLARNMVDTRAGLGEFVMFIALGIVVLNIIIPASSNISTYIFFAFWIYFIFVALDAYLFGRRLKKRILAKYGSVEQGVVWYAVMRSLQLRRLRLPKPQIKRGQAFED